MQTLIVEDDELTSMLFKSFLTGYGKCDLAPNGTSGMEHFSKAHDESLKYDLICLDLMMPDINGIDLLGMIRQWEEEHSISEPDRCKIVMTTAISEDSVIKQAYDAKCDAYLIKPIKRMDLLNTIAELGLIEPPTPKR